MAPVVAAKNTTAPLSHPSAGRWAVLLLAGPVLSYRQMGSRHQDTVARSTPGPGTRPYLFNSAGTPVSVTSLERPAVGFGVQVLVRRVLNGRWAVSTGLGYEEHATSLAVTAVVVNSSLLPPNAPMPVVLPDSLKGPVKHYHLRNSYRFLAVPVRVSYQLGVGRRLRVGVLAGARVALYLGGATADYSGCGCETHSWSATGSPYRSAHLALNMGLDLRYGVAARWDLLAQPTGTAFLTLLDRPGSAAAPRYLLGAGALFGISYGLR